MKNQIQNIALGILGGLVAGAVVGLLYAPDKGKSLRGKLIYRLVKQKERLETLLHDLREGKNTKNEAKHEGQRIVNDAVKQAKEIMEDMSSLMNQIKTKKS